MFNGNKAKFQSNSTTELWWECIKTHSLFAGLPVAKCSMIHSLCRAICQYHRLAQFAVQDSLSSGEVSLPSNYSANSLAELLHLRPNFQTSHFIKSTGEGCISANRFYIIKTVLFCCSKRFSDRKMTSNCKKFLYSYLILLYFGKKLHIIKFSAKNK